MYPSTPMQYNKYKTILEQVSHPQEASVNARNEPTKSTTTLDYYNKNAKKFITGTISVDFGTIQNHFLDKLHPGAEILDYGCGSGRDTKYFLEQGCKVTAIDGSQELCKLASEYTGIPVKHMLFQDLDEKEAYDGIWACSSILHVPANELRDNKEDGKRSSSPRNHLHIFQVRDIRRGTKRQIFYGYDRRDICKIDSGYG